MSNSAQAHFIENNIHLHIDQQVHTCRLIHKFVFGSLPLQETQAYLNGDDITITNPC
ncbi:hypothetical protein OKW42_002771 [Paraburkholderia sp. WC7.3d]